MSENHLTLSLSSDIIYKLSSSSYNSYQEYFSDDFESNEINDFLTLLNYLSPSIPSSEIKQFINLWEVSSKYETIFQGIGSEEVILRSYLLNLNQQNENENELLNQFYQEISRNFEDLNILKPINFRVLHIDGSGECYSHGEFGIFIDSSDSSYENIPESLRDVNLASGYFGSRRELNWNSTSNPNILIKSILHALHLENSRDPLRTVPLP